MNQHQAPLLEALLVFAQKNPAYFRIPAHRFEKGINDRLLQAAGDGIFRLDLSEAEGLDDLHHAQGAILEAEQLASDLWHSEKCFFLINGTTCGNEAGVLSMVKPGEKILIPRNVHKSVLMGLIMAGANPCYLLPEYQKDWNLWGSVNPAKVKASLTKENPDCRAVFLVSPTYYGICSNLEEIGTICHDQEAVLAVDEAHGSHLYFSPLLPKGALEQHADICIQSIHKTAGSMTQSSMLHLGSHRIDKARMASNLQLVQSTSPSYVLMASLDAAREELALHGREMMDKGIDLAQTARRELKKLTGIQVLEKPSISDSSIYDLDITRLVFSARELGISGYRLQELLYNQSGISTELADEENLVCVITYGNTRDDIQRLINGVKKVTLSKEYHNPPLVPPEWVFSLPQKVMNPREAYFHQKTSILWSEAAGHIAGEMIVPYPPGIPLVYPGELITPPLWEQVEDYRKKGLGIHGPADRSLNHYQVIL